ncbi:hypothetical protein ACI2K4_32670 [Micromonospora sp. NPDC050397]|uniref:hypothetical protein n=1 Tax=Micromonospora sp. NPDC050397 TaxID=3364279 RepID=UPI00385090B8
MELVEIEDGMAQLDVLFAPAARAPVDTSDPDWVEKLAAAFATPPMDKLGVRHRCETLLRAIVDRYAADDQSTRASIRSLFDRYPSFRWAAHLPHEWHTVADFRARLILLSARDQGADTRDEILTLQALCDQARRLRLDTAPILSEVAALSSDTDRYGMGSTRDIILRYAH